MSWQISMADLASLHGKRQGLHSCDVMLNSFGFASFCVFLQQNAVDVCTQFGTNSTCFVGQDAAPTGQHCH